MGQPFWMSGATLGMSTPDEDIFSEIFGMELYTIMWQHLVDPAKVIMEEMFFRFLAGPSGSIPTWITEHCFWDWLGFNLTVIPGQEWWINLFLGFEPECIGVQAALKWKFVMAFTIVFGWISWIFVHIIRFIVMIVYVIAYYIFMFLSLIVNFILQYIVLPIFRILWPIISFLIWLIMIPINWIIFVLMILWEFFLSIYLMIICFFIMIHDFLWSIFWYVFMFLYEIFYPIFYWIIQIIWFIPMWIIWAWYTLMRLIWMPLDQICVAIFEWIEVNILDAILEAIPAAEWQPAFGPEFGVAMPIIWYHFIKENIDALP